MESRRLFIDGIETHYLVYEDGRLWSDLRGGRFISGQLNSAGYRIYNTSKSLGKSYLAHTLVAIMFLGPKPESKWERYEINHKDLDKLNNHWTNLEWVTHSYNLMHARKVKGNWSKGINAGRSHSVSTREKMAEAKYKEIRCFNDSGEEMLFRSIEDWVEYFGSYRKRFNNIVCSGRKINGWYVQYAKMEDFPGYNKAASGADI